MKKLISILSLLVVFTMGVNGQNRSIEFEESKKLTEIYQKAIEAEKLVFIDCYTEWCGPCKHLAANIFTLDEVADFFNANFINANFDMETDEDGNANMHKWGVSAFPTLLFVDPHTGDVVHRIVGARPGDELIEAGKIAMDPTKNLAGQLAIYENGNRDPEFIYTLLNNMEDGNMGADVAEILEGYFSDMPVKEMAKEANWKIISKFERDPLSELQKKVMVDRKPFYATVGQESVDKYLSHSIFQAIPQVVLAIPSMGRDAKPEAVAEIENYVNQIDLAGVKEIATPYFDTFKLYMAEEWEPMLDKVVNVLESGVLPEGEPVRATYASVFLMMVSESKDDALIEKAIDCTNKLIEDSGENINQKIQLTMTQFQIYNIIGDEENTNKTYERYLEYNEQLKAQNEGSEG